ncbi:hypothetical protein OAW56_00775 [Gammaproteobacteria bacterium]|jgi:hypothetical protein|nr:hypothetical protein [Gammaproteobacteria bacterium]MDA9920948.1 hypothetical protein [Gammaproteobacteria bacterium]MDB2448350.1 hypothetical protein [Gammaproteobacteria bacterium]MDB2451444.1 hypothetical protein [Gammaproteobacteria bacterium]MDC0347841.1 hypothetical protein [Gammaproteobacteria bacterium]
MNTTTSKGISWGPFTLRIPFIHIKFRAGEFFQGMVISGATAFAAVPVAMGLGLSFEEGVALSFVAGTLIASGPIFFGEPMAPGWITPALPIVIAAFATKGQFNGVYDPATFQFMAAMCIEFTLLVFILGSTGWGKKLIQIIPNGLKAGIILGAALAAFYQVFITDMDKLMLQPISMAVAIILCVITTFSDPFKKLAERNILIKKVGSLGLLPGFIIAALVAYFLKEVTFDIQWGFQVPDVVALFNKTSPLVIGFPSFAMYLEALPLVIIGYTLLFGDLITATEVLNDGQKSRPDEPLDINLDRSHLSIAVRNFLGLLVNPFFPTQGALWTGVHVVVVERWKKGPKEMPSIFDGLGSYYLMGLPILYFTLPFITLMKPLMQMALTLTLILTGFACAYVAMAIPKKNTEMASALLIAVFITFFSAWVGLLVGILLSILVIGLDKN